jgi:pimeloyl-ACP methyl ester carboxylesterase
MEEMWSGAPHLPEANAEELFVEVAPNISVRVLRWVPADSSAASLDPAVVVPGWGSVFEGWRPLLTEWVSRRPIVYIETREKKSARITRKVRREDFEMRHHGHDVAAVLDEFGIDSSEVDWFSSSLGATLLIDAYQNDVLAGRSSILLAPNPDFKFPLWARILLKMPLPKFIHPALVRFAVWVVERRTKEEGQRIRYRRALMSQDLERLLLSSRANIRYSLPQDLSRVSVPCAVMTAKSDTLHGMDKVLDIVDRLPNAVLIEVPSNQYAHEADVLAEIEEFQSSIGN